MAHAYIQMHLQYLAKHKQTYNSILIYMKCSFQLIRQQASEMQISFLLSIFPSLSSSLRLKEELGLGFDGFWVLLGSCGCLMVLAIASFARLSTLPARGANN